MRYAQVEDGRRFYFRVDNGEDLRQVVAEICRKEAVRRGWFQVFGGLAFGSLVVGPVGEEIPPVPVLREITGVHELLGAGTVLPGPEGEPDIHVHASLGRGAAALTGCLRGTSRTFLVMEGLLVEMLGTEVTRRAVDGPALPDFGDGEGGG